MNKEFDKKHDKEFGDVLQVFVEFGDCSGDLISECGDSSVIKKWLCDPVDETFY